MPVNIVGLPGIARMLEIWRQPHKIGARPAQPNPKFPAPLGAGEMGRYPRLDFCRRLTCFNEPTWVSLPIVRNGCVIDGMLDGDT